jgi:hypothetical protein
MDQRKVNPEWFAIRDKLAMEACSNDMHAYSWLQSIMDIVEVWDDLIDGDKLVSHKDIHQTFINLMFFIPQNPFFERHKTYLLPIILTCVNAWMDANELAKSENRRDKQAAWWLKQMGVELYGTVAFLTGGYNHMRDISLKARSILAHEDFEDFERELPCQV